MKNFYLIVRNPITRNYVLKMLVKAGFRLMEGETIKSYTDKWPSSLWPIVCVRRDGKYKNIIDLAFGVDGFPEFSSKNALCVGINELQSFLRYHGPLSMSVNIDPEDIVSIPKPRQPVVFPQAAKYKIKYQTTGGEIKDYIISNPIEETSFNFTTYAFKHGIRTFIKNGVRSFTRVS